MVLDGGGIPHRKQMREVSLPAGGIIADAQVAHGGVVEDHLDPAAHPAGGLRNALPKRLNHFEDEAGVNRGHWQRSNDGKRIGAQRANELFAMFSVTPFGLMLVEITFSRLSERHGLGRL